MDDLRKGCPNFCSGEGYPRKIRLKRGRLNYLQRENISQCTSNLVLITSDKTHGNKNICKDILNITKHINLNFVSGVRTSGSPTIRAADLDFDMLESGSDYSLNVQVQNLSKTKFIFNIN